MSALRVLGYLAFIPLAWQVGNWVVRALLKWSSAKKQPTAPQSAMQQGAAGEQPAEPDVKAGRFIGLLERLLIVFGLLTGKWDIIAAVIALKTVARYKELDQQITAEYFLIGSLCSILWAFLVAILLSDYDDHYGFHILHHGGDAVLPATSGILHLIGV